LRRERGDVLTYPSVIPVPLYSVCLLLLLPALTVLAPTAIVSESCNVFSGTSPPHPSSTVNSSYFPPYFDFCSVMLALNVFLVDGNFFAAGHPVIQLKKLR